jgi:hypothetical protein
MEGLGIGRGAEYRLGLSLGYGPGIRGLVVRVRDAGKRERDWGRGREGLGFPGLDLDWTKISLQTQS